ncbi:MAG: hypothetical protein K2I75_02390 [Clostridiales bacterium]|nr:hypothetical protein [Clostridiales bacterium]
MDKIDAALTATEDNAAAIRALNAKLNAQAEAIERLAERSRDMVISGKADNGVFTFGQIESDGSRPILIVFNETSKRAVYFNKIAVSNGTSPILTWLPAGSGELVLKTSTATLARAVIFARDTVFKKIQ